FCLPAAAPAPAAAAPARTATVVAGERVLVVDDDPSVLQFIRATLVRAGYRGEAAGRAGEAVRPFTAAREPVRPVLSHVLMPGVHGFELVRRLRAHDAGVSVLFMSGHVTPTPDRPFALLTKPFRADGLLQAVRSALARGPHRLRAGPGTGDEAVHSSTECGNQ